MKYTASINCLGVKLVNAKQSLLAANSALTSNAETANEITKEIIGLNVAIVELEAAIKRLSE